MITSEIITNVRKNQVSGIFDNTSFYEIDKDWINF